uniref:Putative secreted protein n=1 Tax=Ixodes scapularis TaxID=6945 RepID=A0A4D5RC69_IXOSC
MISQNVICVLLGFWYQVACNLVRKRRVLVSFLTGRQASHILIQIICKKPLFRSRRLQRCITFRYSGNIQWL